MPRKLVGNNRDSDFRSTLPYLESIGVAVGTAGQLLKAANRFTVEELYPEFARIYARVHVLPGKEVVVVLPARLTVRRAGVMFTSAEVHPSWDQWSLALNNLETNKELLDFVTGGLPEFPPDIINRYFTQSIPLRCCQPSGVIIATGTCPVPANFDADKLVTLKMWLRDERNEEFCFDFRAGVDRSWMAKMEYLRGQRSIPSSAIPTGLYDSVDSDSAIALRHAGRRKDQGHFAIGDSPQKGKPF